MTEPRPYILVNETADGHWQWHLMSADHDALVRSKQFASLDAALASRTLKKLTAILRPTERAA